MNAGGYMVEFYRTSDTTYVGHVSREANSPEMEVSVNFDDWTEGLIKPEQRRMLVNQLFQKVSENELSGICSGFTSVNFRCDGRNYVLTPQTNLILRILAAVFRFFKIIKGDSKVEYTLTTSFRPAFFYTPALTIPLPESPTCTITSFSTKLQSAKAYFDPFTQLATTLFQDYEPFHTWKDVKNHPRRDASQYQVVLDGDNLKGTLIDDATVTNEQKSATIKKYVEFVEKLFGKRRVDKIQTHYNFSFAEMLEKNEPLTPEIIYRLNVGSSYVVIGDVERLVWDLKQHKPLPERITSQLDKLTIPVETLDIKNTEHFAKVMELFLLSKDEYDNIFTGRTLRGKITSWYTQGDEELFKPWIDQQEFSQTCFKIPRRKAALGWDCLYEDLAMILCKKHLHQKELDGTYRVGAVIPAPREDNKPQSYYKVTSLLYNSRGILTYTLEPACPNTLLPVIKLYRSTAISPYNFDGFASFKNDFNPLNSPGYEGAHLLEKHDEEFYKKRTIPVWVGYQYLARSKLHDTPESMQEVYTLLSKANQALGLESESKYAKPTLKQFIRKYDSEFMELIQNYPKNWLTGYYKAWYLLNNCLRHAVQYNYDEHASQVVYLKGFLDEAASLVATTDEQAKLVLQAKKLLSWWNWEEKVAAKKSKYAANDKRVTDLLADVHSYELDEELKQLQQPSYTPTTIQLQTTWKKLSKWNQALFSYAKEIDEDIKQKENQNIAFVGHSLGAACAQRFLASYTALKGRIPVPGQTISARLFDDPAINNEDNEAFIEFGNQHADLLSALHAKFAIIRKQEAGDLVPQTGETHLGAVPTAAIQKKTVKWLTFNAAVLKASSKANHPHIRDNPTAHGRMFADALQKKGTKEERRTKKQHLAEFLKNSQAHAAQIKHLQQELAGDYSSTEYDACRQWEFDYPPNGKVWRELSTLWNLPLPQVIDSLVMERLRSYYSAAFRSGFFQNVIPKIMRVFAQLAFENPLGDENHGPWRLNCNSKGVLIVTETG
jgi:hypothetical protein